MEYSINEIIMAEDKELLGKVFTMDKTLSGKKMDEMIGVDFDFKNQIKDIQAMQDVNLEFMVTFKFFKIQKSIVKTQPNEPIKFMLAFVDIS